MAFNSHLWIVSKNKELVDQYLESIDCKAINDLDVHN
jgi:hypothetical protein